MADEADGPVERGSGDLGDVGVRRPPSRWPGRAAVVAAILAAACVLPLLLAGILALRADDRSFVVRATAVGPSELCFSRDGSAAECVDRRDILDLPANLAAGQCLRLRSAHPVLRFVGLEDCN